MSFWINVTHAYNYSLHEKKWKSNQDLLIMNNNYGFSWCIVAKTSKCMLQADQWIISILISSERVYISYFYVLYLSLTGFLPSPEEFVELYIKMKGIGK